MRGENTRPERQAHLPRGTSPRARGKHNFHEVKISYLGNIPACAGKTPAPAALALSAEEHPRVRGENIMCDAEHVHSGGTSPRARGKHFGMRNRDTDCRNIPACAGKTLIFPPSGVCVKEHPRVRGENCPLYTTIALWFGTSPRARGKHATRKPVRVRVRNIPACAGKTGHKRNRVQAAGEHPRVRGENIVASPADPRANGTSPRARGKRPLDHGQRVGWWNIPACAGKTASAWWLR